MMLSDLIEQGSKYRPQARRRSFTFTFHFCSSSVIRELDAVVLAFVDRLSSNTLRLRCPVTDSSGGSKLEARSIVLMPSWLDSSAGSEIPVWPPCSPNEDYSISRFVAHLNDYHSLTREQIAAYLRKKGL